MNARQLEPPLFRRPSIYTRRRALMKSRSSEECAEVGVFRREENLSHFSRVIISLIQKIM